MKKFNLFNEIITTDKNKLLQAINKNEEFAINISGDIINAPFNSNEIYIYKGKVEIKTQTGLTPSAPQTLQDMFGKNYQIVEDGNRILIKAFSNWQALIGINTPNASYDDTTADGVAEFSNKDLEDIGWNATEFNINYRSLVEVLEDKCDGTVLCIEQEEPYQFSGLGFIADDKEAYNTLLKYCQDRIKKLMSEDTHFAKENLDDDELEALEFFKID